MKKLLTIILAIAMILQVTPVVFATDLDDQAPTVTIDLDVYKAGEAAAAKADVVTTDAVGLKATIDTTSIKKTFKDLKESLYAGANDSQQELADSTTIRGGFTIKLAIDSANAANFDLGKVLTSTAEDMSGFNTDTKRVFKETADRVVTTNRQDGKTYVYITLSVNDDVTLGNFESKLKDTLIFTAEDLNFKKAGEYKLTATVDGTVKVERNGKDYSMKVAANTVEGEEAVVSATNPTTDVAIKVTGDIPATGATVKFAGRDAVAVTADAPVATFDKIADGTYNVVVTAGTAKVTKVVTVPATEAIEIALPVIEAGKGNINTEVKDGADPAATDKHEKDETKIPVVENLDDVKDAIAADNAIKNEIDNGKNVDLVVTVKDNQKKDDLDAGKQAEIDKIETEVKEQNKDNKGQDATVETTITTVKTDVIDEGGNQVAIGEDTKKQTTKVKIPYKNLTTDKKKVKLFKVVNNADGSTSYEPVEVAEDAITEDAITVDVALNEEVTFAIVAYDDSEAAAAPDQEIADPQASSQPDGGSGSGSGNSVGSGIYKPGYVYTPSSTATVTWKNPFTDVSESDWFYDVVRIANQNQLMNGVSASSFAPNDSITRGMFVTVIYRMEGSPITGVLNFTDVPSWEYYAAPIAWAHKAGIVKGISETEFAPDEIITREQMATIIYRYMEYSMIDVSASAELDYTDAASISEYAIPAVKWNKAAGIMSGNPDGTFAPLANATRAEAAAVFVRVTDMIKELAE